MDYYSPISLIAQEDLVNNSICVKDGEYVRNTKSLDELKSETFVWVHNAEIVYLPREANDYNPKSKIHKGDRVRCFKLKL